MESRDKRKRYLNKMASAVKLLNAKQREELNINTSIQKYIKNKQHECNENEFEERLLRKLIQRINQIFNDKIEAILGPLTSQILKFKAEMEEMKIKIKDLKENLRKTKINKSLIKTLNKTGKIKSANYIEINNLKI